MTREYTPLEQNRLEKLHRLREQGIEPYPHRISRTHTSAQAISAYEAVEAQEDAEPVRAAVAGRLRSMRTMGKIAFAHIEDNDGRLQLFFRV
ncbi:MAG: lysine--tRNA ligase, partial [Anaerolineae bacterium]